MNKKKTTQTLNRKIWYRLLKVCYFLMLIVFSIVVVVATYSLSYESITYTLASVLGLYILHLIITRTWYYVYFGTIKPKGSKPPLILRLLNFDETRKASATSSPKNKKKTKTPYYCEDCDKDIDQERWYTRIFFFIPMLSAPLIGLLYLLFTQPYQCPHCKSRTSLWRTMNGQKEKIKANSKWAFITSSIVLLVLSFSLALFSIVANNLPETEESLSIEKYLEKEAQTLRTDLPYEVDELTTLVRVNTYENNFQYIYYLKGQAEEYDFDEIEKIVTENHYLELSEWTDLGIVTHYNYYDDDEDLIGIVKISD